MTFDTPLVELPRGSMFEYEEAAYLVVAHGYLPWSFEGYAEPKVIDAATVVKVLTPQSVIRAFARGSLQPSIRPDACNVSPWVQ